MRSKDQNKVAIIRHLWNLTLDVNRSLQIDQILENKLKQKSLWEVKANSKTSRLCRKILNFKNIVRDKIKKIIGNQESTLLWHDNQHLYGPFVEIYSKFIIYNMSLSNQAKAKEIIRDGRWIWPSTNSTELMEIKESILMKPKEGEDITI